MRWVSWPPNTKGRQLSTPVPRTKHEFELTVARKEVISDGVVRLTLSASEGGPLPAWEPGAHIDLVLRDDLIRQYSLCGDPSHASQLEVAVLREVAGRGGSEHVHDQLAEGDLIRVQGPRNHFQLVDAQKYVFIAGGIGITPIIPMIRSVASRGAAWQLIYGGRTRGTMAFRDQLLTTYPDHAEIRPQDETGLLDIDGIVAELSGVTDTVIYCCGPEPLLAVVEQACATHHVALHVERFAPKAGALDGPCEAFEVELARTGITLAVPAELSIIEVLEEAGIEVSSSCEEGVCGTCRTGVLAGVPDHHDSVLTDEEHAAGDTMTVCVSRSRSQRLVLDL
jgi:ferredoxin-NADP reductase